MTTSLQKTKVMAALVILDAVRQDLLPTLGDSAPEIIWDPTVALMARLRAGERADALFAIVNGTPPDEGVMVELGVSIALGKPTFLFRDDFRKCTDSDEYPLNLMIFLGIPYDSWNDYYYRSLDEIVSKKKAIYKWLKS